MLSRRQRALVKKDAILQAMEEQSSSLPWGGVKVSVRINKDGSTTSRIRGRIEAPQQGMRGNEALLPTSS